MSKVAFIGLGVMGYPMAGTSAPRAGMKSPSITAPRQGRKLGRGIWRASRRRRPAEAAKDADFVFTCVGNDDDLRSVTLGDGGALAGMKPGAILIDNTTASADIARELHASAKAKGAAFIDAPVSGGQAGAENGVLTVMCGGDEAVFAKAKPVIACYARMVADRARRARAN